MLFLFVNHVLLLHFYLVNMNEVQYIDYKNNNNSQHY